MMCALNRAIGRTSASPYAVSNGALSHGRAACISSRRASGEVAIRLVRWVPGGRLDAKLKWESNQDRGG